MYGFIPRNGKRERKGYRQETDVETKPRVPVFASVGGSALLLGKAEWWKGGHQQIEEYRARWCLQSRFTGCFRPMVKK